MLHVPGNGYTKKMCDSNFEKSRRDNLHILERALVRLSQLGGVFTNILRRQRHFSLTNGVYSSLLRCVEWQHLRGGSMVTARQGPLFKKNLSASKPFEHLPSGEKMSEGLGGNIGCSRDKTSSWYQTGSPM